MAQPLGEFLGAGVPELQEIAPLCPEEPRAIPHLRLLPPIVEAPQAETPRDPRWDNVMAYMIYAAERGEYENLVDSEAFIAHHDPYAAPKHPEEKPGRSVHPFHDHSSLQLSRSYLYI